MYTCLGRPTHALLYIGLARAETYGIQKTGFKLWFCIRWPRIYLQIHLRRFCVLLLLWPVQCLRHCWVLYSIGALVPCRCERKVLEADKSQMFRDLHGGTQIPHVASRLTKEWPRQMGHSLLMVILEPLNALSSRSLVETGIIRHVTGSDLTWPRSDIIRPEVAWKRLGKA